MLREGRREERGTQRGFDPRGGYQNLCITILLISTSLPGSNPILSSGATDEQVPDAEDGGDRFVVVFKKQSQSLMFR